MLNYENFIDKNKSMLIAPAGFGKTHTIAECLKHTKESEKQLILTHTHAGVASIKEKIKREHIPAKKYNVETISSFAQKYTLSFYDGKDVPEQKNSKEYYPFIIEKAIDILRIKPIQKVITNTYNGLFVDEYQDCTKRQHKLILELSNLLPTRILGDFLQGIFGFNGESLVDMRDCVEMGDFFKNQCALSKPQRWLNGNNANLGNELKQIRDCLINKRSINLNNYTSIETCICKELDLYKPKTNYYKKMQDLLKEENLLVIHPNSTSIHPRIKIIQQFSNRLALIESIDDKKFYELSVFADQINKDNIVSEIRSLSSQLFGGLNEWFNDTGFKNKRKKEDKALLEPIRCKIDQLEQRISFSLISGILKDIKKLKGVKTYRRELFSSFTQALEEAEYNKLSVETAMTNKRNLIRRIGRKVFGKCIGTTLLTKGLEFDTVAIINAHKFDCPKHLYVAMTRASKRLLIFTKHEELGIY